MLAYNCVLIISLLWLNCHMTTALSSYGDSVISPSGVAGSGKNLVKRVPGVYLPTSSGGLVLDCDPRDEFKCADGKKCIARRQRCDGRDNCPDRSDEEFCPHAKECNPWEYECADGQECIDRRYLCDGREDCPDRSDEVNCPRPTPHGFYCHNGQVIDSSRRCDGRRSCDDSSDEVDCSFYCHNGQVIDINQRCDDHGDCSDISDEVNCRIECNPHQWNCDDGKKCIDSRHRCDGSVECPDRSDENYCPRPTLECPVDHRSAGDCKNPPPKPSYLGPILETPTRCYRNSDCDSGLLCCYDACASQTCKNPV